MTKAPSGRPPSEFMQLLEAEVTKRGSIRALAKALKISEGRLGRVLRGEYPFGVATCLRFSEASGEPPSRVLRAAGKGDVAGLIEKLYGVGEDVISPSERDVLRRFRSLPPKTQGMLREFLEMLPTADLAGKLEELRRKRGGGRRGA